MSLPLPVPQAAKALGVHVQTLRRWLREGAPQARRGQRGRGGGALVDPAAVEAWRRQDGLQDALLAIAGDAPEIVATAMHEAHRMIEGPDKARAAGYLAGAWLVTTDAFLDRLRVDCPAVPELQAIPAKVSALRAICAGSGSIGSTSTDEPRNKPWT